MKRLSAFLIAFTMLGLVSCESDKPDDPNNTAISEPVEEIPAEPVFTEYSQSDFAQINVAINKQEGEPVIPVNTYDLRKLADVKALSPCKLPENRDKITEKYKPSAFINFGTNEFDEEGFNNFCDNPSEAFFRNFAVCGDKAAVYADYDEFCNYNHCYKIFEYDLKTGGISELYSYSSADEGEDINEMKYIGGELYLIREHENSGMEEMCRVSDGKLEVLFSAGDVPSYRNALYLTFYDKETDRFILASRDDTYNADMRNEYIKYTLVEYDAETGKFTEIFRKEEEADSKTWDSFEVFLNGDDIITTGKDDDKCTFIESESFRINTGIKGLKVQSIQGNRIVALTNDTVKTMLYTYDLDKMECYVSNVNGVDDAYLVDGNVLMSYGSWAKTLLIPELGASFGISSRDLRFEGHDGNRLWFAEASSAWSSGPEGYYIKTDDAVGDLVIIGE